MVPPPLGTVFDTPRVSAFDHTVAFGKAGAEMLKTIADVTQRIRGDGNNMRKSGGAYSPAAGPSQKKSAHVVWKFASTEKCRWPDCIFFTDPFSRLRPLPPPPAMVGAVVRRYPDRLGDCSAARGWSGGGGGKW